MPIPALLGGALISGGASIFGNLLGNSGRRRNQDRANAWNLEQWHRQNAYNDPSAQMARLKNAGLNPNLIYGTSPTSATGNADKVAPSDTPDYQIDNPMREISSYANVKQTEANTDNLRKQNHVIVQDANLKAAQTTDMIHRGRSSKIKADIDKELLQSTLDGLKESNRLKAEATIGAQIENKYKDQSQKEQLRELKNRADNASEITKGSKLTNEIKQLEIDLKRLGIEPGDPAWSRVMSRIYNAHKTNIHNFGKYFRF